MSSQRQLMVWILAALAASALFVGVLVKEYHHTRRRWSVFMTGDPHAGTHLFQEKGCVRCHAVNGVGGKLAPDLGYKEPAESTIDQLVVAMWNHAPRMWERMRGLKLTYPSLNDEEMAHLFAYLYTARYVDEPGDEMQGRRLFETKSCIRCHTIYGVGGGIGPDLGGLGGVDTPIAWTQAMWNHAPAMESRMQQRGIPWPKFEGREMNDLLAYIRGFTGGPRREFELLPANPERGWQLFQTKSCIVCHSVKGEGGRVGPELAPKPGASLTLVQFAGLMWNHSPEMWATMKAKGIERPAFEGQEMADLIAFLYSVRYFELGGSPIIGQELFNERKCGRCHGTDGRGGEFGPSLRKGDRLLTPVSLAQALWSHGPRMYTKSQELGLGWPTLNEGDLSHLLAFLNSPPTREHR